MKKFACALIFLIIPTIAQSTTLPFDPLLANKNWYKVQAKQWVNEYLLSVPKRDLCLIANVLYDAWVRSAANIATQKYVQNGLQTMVDIAHTFDTTRLTPKNYFTKQQYNATSFDHLNNALEFHKTASKTYYQAIDLVIDKEALESINAQEALKKAHRAARTAVSQGVASVVSHFDVLLTQAHTWLESMIKILFKNKPLDTANSKAIFQTLWKYIEKLLAKAFISSDSKYAAAWYDSAQALLVPHNLHNALWNVMDQVRAAYYQAYFEAVYEYMQELTAERTCFIQIDETGWIKNATQTLPDPHSLLPPFALS